jgi:hypothetical protein
MKPTGWWWPVTPIRHGPNQADTLKRFFNRLYRNLQLFLHPEKVARARLTDEARAGLEDASRTINGVRDNLARAPWWCVGSYGLATVRRPPLPRFVEPRPYFGPRGLEERVPTAFLEIASGSQVAREAAAMAEMRARYGPAQGVPPPPTGPAKAAPESAARGRDPLVGSGLALMGWWMEAHGRGDLHRLRRGRRACSPGFKPPPRP